MQRKLIKVISTLLVMLILFANSAAILSYAADTFLSEEELENQGTSTKHTGINFDVYYDGGKHTKSIDIDSTDTKLNVSIYIANIGYLKDITVDFADSNFEISDDGTNSEQIQTFDAENKKITFNQINGAKEVVKSLNIFADKSDEINADMLNRDNKVKLTATYVNNNAEESQITKEIVIHTGWQIKEATAVLNHELTKYIPYSVNGTKKIIVQEKITSGVEKSDLPIKETNIEVIAPQINNEYPENVTVMAKSTKATNGDENGDTFVYDGNYDKTTGKIVINAKNEAIDGKLNWAKDALDEYLITYVYSSDVYTAVNGKTVQISYTATSKVSLYNDGNGINELNASINGYDEQKEQLGDVIDFEVESTPEIYKGYMYNNLVAAEKDKKETEYIVKYTANIPYAEIIDGFTLNFAEDQFAGPDAYIPEDPPIPIVDLIRDGIVISTTKNSYIKTLKISKNEFDKILGENGQIVLKENTAAEKQTVYETITTSTVAENDYITVDLSSYNIKSLILETSKPQTVGKINFELTKAISKKLDDTYTEEKIGDVYQIKTSATPKVKNGTTESTSEEVTSSIHLKEPTQKASITTNKETLSTILTNEDVEIKVTLENDSIDDIMYNEPTVKIKLPNNIENINIKDVVPYFDNELTIGATELIDNEDGTKTIAIKLNGSQTKYNNVAAKGATIVVTADITLNKLTPTTNTTIEAEVVNGNTAKTTVSASTNIKYVAPTGVVTTNTMTGYNGDEKLEAINGEAKAVLIPTKAEQKEVTFTMEVINNYQNTLDNVVVLGRTPFAGNKDVITLQDLGSTMNLPLSSEITVNNIDATKVTIYYSENGEATTDLSNTSNNWVTTVTDYSTVKSYMIVLNDYTMNIGDLFNFSYRATIPANLDYDQSSYENYAVFFNNNQTSGIIQDKASAVAIGITTGTAAKLEASLTSEIPDGGEVKGGTDLKYTLKVENKGSKNAENTIASIALPSAVTYIEEKNAEAGSYVIEYDEESNVILKLNLGTIGAVSNIEKVITLKTATTALAESEIAIKATVTADGDITAETNTITNKLIKTYFRTQVKTSVEDHKCIMEGYTYLYKIAITSSDSYILETNEKITRENTILKVTLPEELTYDSIILEQYNSELKGYEDISSTATVSTNGKTVEINIGSIDGGYGKTLTIKSKIGILPEGIYQKDVTTTATIQADGTDVEKIADVTDTINKPAIKITQTCNIPEDTVITAGEEFTYTFTMENLSDTILDNIILTDDLPEGVKFKLAEVTYPEGTTSKFKNVDEDGNPTVKLNLSQKQTITVNIKVTAKSLNADTKIANKATISNEYVKAESNQIAHTVKKFVNTDIEIDPGTGEEKQTKKIIGTIWIDGNKDGIKDVDEEKVSGVTVLLLDNGTGDIAIDATGNKAIAKTTSAGAYMFNYLNAGKYTVIFLYDSSNYSATAYQKEGVDSSKNSDAIDKEVIYQGVKRIGAVTEEITVADENKYDIDLGIVENAKFDLKLDKTVASITVNNSKNVQKHEYNKNLAKIDFEAKYADASTMIVEYKFTITNEGAIPGYVKKLADYLPEELKFSTELNTDWYEGKDGTIYNSSLANTIINPGESKTITLLLTKNMTEESFGLITNTAEIYETSNNYGLEDVDSKPANKATNEDDISTANVLTTVKTGEIVIYATLTLTIIAIIGVGIYLIKKKVIK